MRRIAIYLAAAAAALSAAGCKMDDGTARDIYRPARTLWHNTSLHLNDAMSICRCLSALDAMLSPEWSDIADKLEMRYFGNAAITVGEDGLYDIGFPDYYELISTHYLISTASRPVSADNAWTATCVDYRAESDAVLTHNEAGLHLDLAANYNRGYYHQAAIDLSCTVDSVYARISVTLDGGRAEIFDSAENPSYRIVYDIASPLHYDSTGMLLEGVVEIVYDDFIGHTTDRVRVTVDRGYATYEYM